jgi:hypothetical protein
LATSQLKTGLLIRILPQTGLGQSVAFFPGDRQARGLSPHTVDLYPPEAHSETNGGLNSMGNTASICNKYVFVYTADESGTDSDPYLAITTQVPGFAAVFSCKDMATSSGQQPSLAPSTASSRFQTEQSLDGADVVVVLQ